MEVGQLWVGPRAARVLEQVYLQGKQRCPSARRDTEDSSNDASHEDIIDTGEHSGEQQQYAYSLQRFAKLEQKYCGPQDMSLKFSGFIQSIFYKNKELYSKPVT